MDALVSVAYEFMVLELLGVIYVPPGVDGLNPTRYGSVVEGLLRSYELLDDIFVFLGLPVGNFCAGAI